MGAHDVRFHRSGTKRVRHPLVGELSLAFEALELPADTGLTLQSYSAEATSQSERRLREVADWTSTRARLAATAPTSED